MQSKRASEIRQKWGSKKCDHPEFDKEYDLGAQTGDYICMQCGNCFTEREVKEIESKRNKKS